MNQNSNEMNGEEKESRNRKIKRCTPFKKIIMCRTISGSREIFKRTVKIERSIIVQNKKLTKSKVASRLTISNGNYKNTRTSTYKSFKCNQFSKVSDIDFDDSHEKDNNEGEIIINILNDDSTDDEESTSQYDSNLETKLESEFKEKLKKITESNESINTRNTNTSLDTTKQNLYKVENETNRKFPTKTSRNFNRNCWNNIKIITNDDNNEVKNINETFKNTIERYAKSIGKNFVECLICDKIFDCKQSDYYKHIATHFNGKFFYCFRCKIPFNYCKIKRHLHKI